MKSRHIFRTSIPALILVLVLLLSLCPAGIAYAAELPASRNTFAFSETGVTASDSALSGFQINGTSLQINESGVYTITGSCAEGSISVKKGTTGVTLILEELTLGCSTTAPLRCNKGTETTVYISGTVTLTDNESLENEESDDFEGAAIKVKSENASLTILGSGTLNINGNYKNGIKAAATAALTLDGPTVNITAANHGIAADHSLTIKSGTVAITAGNEGLKASPDTDDTVSAGSITISGGSIDITSDDDGIHADGTLLISGGAVTVSAGDDGIKSERELTISGGSVTVQKSYEGMEGAAINLTGGSGRITASDDGINAANSDLTNYDFALNISGGEWYVNAVGDGLDSNGTITISGGVTEVFGAANNGNGALDSERGITYNGGTILAVGMSGMAEVPSSGTYVAFGSTGMMGGGLMGGMPGGMNGRQGRMPNEMNGQQGQMPPEMNGQQGQVPPEMNGQQGQMPPEMNGQQGRMRGSVGQQESASSLSINAGSTLVIKDSSGNTLYTAKAVRSADSVIFASEQLTEGESYTLFVDGAEIATSTASAGTGMAGGMPAGQRPGQGQPDQLQPGQQPGQQSGSTDSTAQLPSAQDTPSDWAAAEVRDAISTGLVPENLQRNYQSTVNRGDVIRMFINLIEQLSGEDIDLFLAEQEKTIDENAFTDTSDHAALAAKALGIIKGVDSTHFAADVTLTRSQIVAILNRVAEIMGIDTSECSHSFADVSGHWVESELGWAAENGIIKGRDSSTFDPEGVLTVQEAIAITDRAMKLLH